MIRIESLLSARLFLTPQLVGERIFFVSNLSGHLSLYTMDAGGSVPEPLLPGHIALQNPELIGDHVLHEWSAEHGTSRLLYGTQLDQRPPDYAEPHNSIFACHYTPGDQGLVFITALFEDSYGLGYLDLSGPGEPVPVRVTGTAH